MSGCVLTLLAGCGHGHTQATAAARVAPGEWKALIRDSYDGQISGHHSCAIARAAVVHVPHDMIRCTSCAVLQAYERRVC